MQDFIHGVIEDALSQIIHIDLVHITHTDMKDSSKIISEYCKRKSILARDSAVKWTFINGSTIRVIEYRGWLNTCIIPHKTFLMWKEISTSRLSDIKSRQRYLVQLSGEVFWVDNGAIVPYRE